MIRTACTTIFGLLIASSASADDFYRLDEALPSAVDIRASVPVFDFDTDGCLPSAGISRLGQQNGGLNPTGSITGGCRAGNFLETANTLHRHACVRSGGDIYCGHFYALYFLKDQVTFLGGGHRHDWEHAAIWTKNGVPTHGGYSAHGKLFSQAIGTLDQQDGHMKIVYHKDGALTHCMRFAKPGEVAENAYGRFVTPNVVSWQVLWGDGLSNAQMRARLDAFDYGSGQIPMRDDNFLGNLNTYKPGAYPMFTSASLDSAG